MAFPRVNGFEIHSLLGEGGMGAVYRATETATGREVALKVLRGALVTDEEFVLRFKREAKALALVDHPSVARFYSTGSDKDILYFAMEFVEGEPLAQRIADGPLGPRDALAMAAQVADGLAAAHKAGLIHRDVKPANILLVPLASGDPLFQAKLTDFGIARRADGTAITAAGSVVGSLPYMSPEQVQGQRLSPVSDIYSLGVVLFEALTGRLPFDDADEAALATRILTQPAPLLPRKVSGVPVSLSVLLVRMLAKDPSLRPSSAEHLATRLRELREGKADSSIADEEVEVIGRDGLFSRTLAALCRTAVRLAPLGPGGDSVAQSAGRMARERMGSGGRDAALLEAAVARRAVRQARREMKLLERKRADRLRKAVDAESRSSAAGAEARQTLSRLARDMRDEAGIFEKRIASLSATVAKETARAASLLESARARKQ
jgi:hypothetical protein